MLFSRRGFAVLNCGYQEAGYPHVSLPPEWESDRLGFQLYHRLVRDVPLTGRDVVEVGCGRGGGAAFLSDHFEPDSYVATDASFLLVAAGRRRQHNPRLRFQCSRADRLPFSAHSFDVGLTVETIHMLPDKPRFLAELARVLRPKGELLIADFFYTRQSSPKTVARFHAQVEKSSFHIVGEEDWTENARGALETQSPGRLATIDRLPRWMQPAALSFAGTTQSPLYRQMSDGRASYQYLRLQRR